ncbi:MAG: GAF domain-containing protein, partial [Mastigocladus sp. ERB_26_1]
CNREFEHFNSISQVLALNISTLKKQVLKLTAASLNWMNSARQEDKEYNLPRFQMIV